MRVLVTGAGGLLGRRVVERLLRPGALGETPPSAVTLVDINLPPAPAGAEVRRIKGSITKASVIAAAIEGGVDLLFHLASVPGGAAQADYARGRAVNLEGTLALFDAVADASAPPRIVFTSSIAVLGADGRGVVDASTPLRPTGSYGAHKLITEVQLADLTRGGLVDGRSVRPAAIVPRPPERYDGFATAWMSDIFHAITAGRFTVRRRPPTPSGCTRPIAWRIRFCTPRACRPKGWRPTAPGPCPPRSRRWANCPGRSPPQRDAGPRRSPSRWRDLAFQNRTPPTPKPSASAATGGCRRRPGGVGALSLRRTVIPGAHPQPERNRRRAIHRSRDATSGAASIPVRA